MPEQVQEEHLRKMCIRDSIKTVSPDSKIYGIAQQILSKEIVDKKFFDLFLVLFIASVGLLAAKDVGRVIKKYGLKFIVLGLLITFTGAAAVSYTHLSIYKL